MRKVIMLAAICFGLLGAAITSQALTLIENGQPSAKIYLQADAPKDVQDAAAELSRVLQIMSGAKLEVVAVADAGAVEKAAPGIVLGALAEGLGVKMTRQSRARDGCRYKVQGNKLCIVGESPGGVYTGALRLLESLGCGWYAPGVVGEVIPARATVMVPDTTDRTDISNSINRRFWYGGKNGNGAATDAWLRRLNGNNYQSGSWNHAYAGLIPVDELKAHPEYGSLNRGQRTTKQLCTTNPEVIRLAAETLQRKMAQSDQLVFAAGPNDGGNLCECGECAKLDTPGYLEPSSGKPACSDRIFKFASDLADITAKQFPNRDLGILVYSEYSRIPLKMTQMNPNVFPMIAPIRRCRIHGPGNPHCEMNTLWQEEIRGWARLSKKMGFYMYNYNLADSLLPFSKVDFYQRLVGEVDNAKIEQLAWIFETIDNWSSTAPSFYLSARLSWNTGLDIDAEMDRYYRGFYGAAYVPMKRYWTRLDTAYAGTNSHAGSSYGMHKFWTPAVLQSSRADIEEAKRLAATPRERDAVAMAEAGLHSAELFMTVWNAVARCDFAAAEQGQAALQAHVAEMTKHTDPNWAHDRYAFGYYNTFIGRTVAGGAAALKDGGAVIARLPDAWKFSTDEQAVGTAQGWWQPAFDDAAWKTMGAMSTSWADEGLTWYMGDAWYRARFTVPAGAKGKDLRLWFGGFDHNVDVYLNGKHLGEKTGFVKPQEFTDVAGLLNYGGENALAVRVSAGSLAEIGTGGLMMPVMLYTPGAPAVPADPTKGGVGYEM
ncbi:MAG: DUF4838 domain-containing protein [Armatimonadota bacterium]